MENLVNIVLPVFIVAGLGALANLYLKLDARTLSRVTFYLFTPALVFDGLVTSDVSGTELGQMAAVFFLGTLILWLLGMLAARLLRLGGPTQAAFLSAILIMNAGNYGLPVVFFAFGEEGLARAAVMVTLNVLVSSSLGVYLNVRGRAPARLALRQVASVPLVYAAILGLAMNWMGMVPPEPIEKAIHLLGQAAVPTMLLVLGAQLIATKRNGPQKYPVPTLTAVTVLRLLVAPALAWGLAGLLGMQGVTRDVVVLVSAMPTAVIITILATEFDSDPPLAVLCVIITTLASLPTITVLLNWLL